MQNMNWCKDCSYASQCYSNHPMMQGQYFYPNPMYGSFETKEEDFEDMLNMDISDDESFSDVSIDNDVLKEIKDEAKYEIRAPRDVDRVIRIINQRAAREINEIVRIGMDRKLLNYLIRSMVTYIDRNFNKYVGTKQQKMAAAERDLRRELYWVFDIMNLYGVSPATQARLINTVVEVSIENLRPPKPTPPPTPPMPRRL